MKKTTRKLLSLAMASAMAASLLTGCGGGGANETTAAAGTEKTEAGKTETEAGSTEAAAEGTADADYSQDVITWMAMWAMTPTTRRAPKRSGAFPAISMKR